MLEVTDILDRIGYWSLEVWGGATFDACLRFLREDPWERLKTLRKALPNTQASDAARGQNLVGYKHYADDVVKKFVERSAKNGIDVFRIFDALNDIRNMEVSIKAAKEAKAIVEACICYTTSPVHTHEGFVEMAKKLEALGADTICVKDMAGLLTPPAAYALVKMLRENPGSAYTHTLARLFGTSFDELP